MYELPPKPHIGQLLSELLTPPKPHIGQILSELLTPPKPHIGQLLDSMNGNSSISMPFCLSHFIFAHISSLVRLLWIPFRSTLMRSFCSPLATIFSLFSWLNRGFPVEQAVLSSCFLQQGSNLQ